MSANSKSNTFFAWSLAGKCWLGFWILTLLFTTWVIWRPGRSDSGPELLAICVWLIGAVAWWFWYGRRRRAIAMARTSQALGLEFTPRVKDLSEFDDFALFQRCSERYGLNQMRGRIAGLEVVLMDYVHGEKARTSDFAMSASATQTIVIFPDAGAGLPNLVVVPKVSMWEQNLVGRVEVDDLQIGAGLDEEFTKKYTVGGPDADAIRSLFGSETLAFFEQNPGWAVEVVSGKLLAYRDGKRRKPHKCPDMLSQARRIVQTLTGKEGTAVPGQR
jgi:hypothetical protein